MSIDNTRNTLITFSAEERLSLRNAWKARHQAKQLTAADCLLYALLRGKNPRSAFTPVTNPVKLANGQQAWQSLTEAKRQLNRQLPLWLPEALRTEDLHAALKAALATLSLEA